MTSQYVDPFVGLHTHTDGSILDGFSTIPELVARVVEIGQPAVSITDHGNLFNAHLLYDLATKAGIKPIIGLEAYMTPSIGSRTDKEPLYFADGGPDDTSSKGAYTHITLLAKNQIGYQNLLRLSYESYATGYYKKPRIDMDLLRELSEGLIATTGCPSGEVQTRLRPGQFAGARSHAEEMLQIFGEGNYYVELMDHDMTIDLERKVQDDLLRISRELGIPLVATNDSHYTHKHDANAHEFQLCISTHSKMSVPTSVGEGDGGKTRFAFNGEGYYLKTAAEMLQIFPEDKFPGAVSNTMVIADMCDVKIEPRDDLWPSADTPEGKTSAEWLAEEAFSGLARRLPGKEKEQVYIDRLNFELSIIIQKGYPDYYLVVSDFMRWARKNDVATGYGRGSGAGSLVAYCVDITDPDPIRHGLLFERFLNPLRDSPPDFDLDFEQEGRERVIAYVKDKYGSMNVSQVATFGKMKAKNAIKDVARVLELPYAVGEKLTKAMPEAIFGKDMPLKDMYDKDAKRYDEAQAFRDLVVEENAQEVVKTALQLEGRIRSTGVHAAAVIISAKPIYEYVPVMVRQADEARITQWDYPTSEHIGLMKMDFLGLRNLDIVKKSLQIIKKMRGVDIDIQEIIQGALDDRATYDLLREGNTLGVFQLDGGPMRSLLRLMRPDNFEDISALIALYRPGPMGANSHTNYALRKNGLQEVDYINDELAEALKPVLEETYGIIVYQEQVQKIAQVISNYTLGEADNLRRAMGKKKREVLDKEWVPFLAGARKNGYSEAAVKQLWDILVPFADYAFNKSHSVAYGLLSYLTAYLKANYKSEYVAALLSSVTDSNEKTAQYLDDAKRNQVSVLPPNVSRSDVDYTSDANGVVLFGLKAIRGVGENTAQEIVEERTNNGKYKDLSDLFSRLPKAVLNKRVMEGLTLGGAFDDFGLSRRAIHTQLPDLLKKHQKADKVASSGTISLFDLDDVLEYSVLPMNEWPKMEKLQLERGVLGLYVSAHPLDGLRIDNMSNATVGGILEGNPKPLQGWPGPKDMPVRIAGLLTGLQVRRSRKSGDMFGIATFEDKTGTIECLIWPKAYAKVGSFLKQDNFYQFIGFPKEQDGEYSFSVDNARLLDFSETSGNLAVRVKLTASQWEKGRDNFTKILTRHLPPLGEPGDDVIISLRNAAGDVWEESHEFKVKRSSALVQELMGMFGSKCIGRWLKVDKKPDAVEDDLAPNPDSGVEKPVSDSPAPQNPTFNF